MPRTARVALIEYKMRCVRCNRDQLLVRGPNLNLGDIIYPSPGHSEYGLCVFCRRPGLRVVERSG
jgi:hypothetical protein